MSTISSDISVRSRVEAFLDHEADCADRHLYSEWLELWSPTGTYWVPCNADDYDPRHHVSIIYDDYQRLQERCFRLSAEGAHAQDPPSRLCRIVGNIQFDNEACSDDGELHVRANMVLVEVRSGLKTVYAARLEYRLLLVEDAFRINLKKVMLLDNDEALGNLTFIL